VGRIEDTGFIERVTSLAALAAQAAMKATLRIHARQRQLQRNTELDSNPDHV
jgi:hypothetical protein